MSLGIRGAIGLYAPLNSTDAVLIGEGVADPGLGGLNVESCQVPLDAWLGSGLAAQSGQPFPAFQTTAERPYGIHQTLVNSF